MTRQEKIRETLDCLGFLLFIAMVLMADIYASRQDAMHSENVYREAYNEH